MERRPRKPNAPRVTKKDWYARNLSTSRTTIVANTTTIPTGRTRVENDEAALPSTVETSCIGFARGGTRAESRLDEEQCRERERGADEGRSDPVHYQWPAA
jgi:hypothetical protein